ncbi:hypothetical protein [Halocalculus aciditolerans]|nr:hypothetical protein [Halocalculus aciditolerans]
MRLRNWLRTHSLTTIALWSFAVGCIVLALTNTPLLGIEPLMLAVLATVFAATASSTAGRATDDDTRCH